MKTFIQFIIEETKPLVPAHHMPYREYKKIPGENHLQFHPDHLTTEHRNNPSKKHWAVYSLGSSHHDPQAMYKIVSGHKPPEGVQNISSHKEHEAAWNHIQNHQKQSWGLSRNS